MVLGMLGGGLFLVPRSVGALYGASASSNGTNAAQTAGAAIFALGILAWIGQRRGAGAAERIAVPVLFVWFGLKSVVAYVAVEQRLFYPTVGMTILIFDLLLAIVYGYFFSATIVEAISVRQARGARVEATVNEDA